MLKLAAKLLKECAKSIGFAARIGGDEFAVILPNFDEAKANKLIANIGKAFADRAYEMCGADIALGYAVKTEIEQELSDIIDEADRRMYQKKRNDRRRNDPSPAILF